MVEAFRKQLRDREETIDQEKAALNQFISGLVQDETSESPRKLKAMNFDDLNKRIDDLIKTQLSQNEKLHEERNQLQMDLNELNNKNSQLDQDVKTKTGELTRSQSQYEQQVNDNRELSEAKQKLETLRDDQKKEIKRLEDELRKLGGEMQEQKSENS